MTEEDGMGVAGRETEFAEMDGYTAESRAGELLLGLGIGIEQHFGPMSEVSPGWKLRVLLAQALFSDPEVLLLDEPTNHLDINTIRWLENILTARNSTMIINSPFDTCLAARSAPCLITARKHPPTAATWPAPAHCGAPRG